MTERTRARLGALLSLGLLTLAVAVLHRELAGHSYRDLAGSFAAVPGRALLAAALATAASYALLAAYDPLAVAALRLRVPRGRAALAGLLGTGFSNTAGHSLLVGTPVRLRLYSGIGLDPAAVARIALFSTLTLWVGYLALAGSALAAAALPWPARLQFLPGATSRPLGAVLLALALAYLAFAAAAGRSGIELAGRRLRPPSLGIALAQVAVSAADWATCALALWALCPAGVFESFPRFLAVFLLAQVTGVASQVPGGAGVFEAALLLLVPGSATALVGPLLAFRVVYYLVPFALAVAVLAGSELVVRRASLSRFGRGLAPALGALAPSALATATLFAGGVLLASGATPGLPERLELLAGVLPLVELSHFVASLIGSALLLIAFGLYRRLDSAWWLALGAALAGVVASLFKGLDWEEALLLAALAGALLLSRRRFYRRGSMLAERFSAGWILAIGTVLASSIWLGFFAYRHVEYRHDLWWQVALEGDAPRFLRATAGAVGVALVFALARLVAGAARRSPPPSEATLDEVAPLVAASPDSAAHLALLGDKRFLLGARRDAFLMYAVEGRSWIAMGDPVGAPAARRELAWRFRELVDRHDAWTVFYQVRADDLPLYLDLGLALVKLGEEARVPLAEFRLDGAHHKGQRNLLHRLEREGVEFEWLAAGSFAASLGELRAVSDAWLAGKMTREKGFSIGFFDPDYLRRCPLAVARRGGRILAFANVWAAAAGEEMSVDLMRYLPDAPPGVMDFLFLRLLLVARERGFRWFNLGLAPLSGLEARRLAPLWHRLGTFAFLHGEHFYNFQGLRQYKAKFDPVWTPRYLASPGGLTLPRVLTHVAARIGGGMRGVLAR